MSATAVPGLTELMSWRTEHLTEGADFWDRAADRWDDAFAEAESQIRTSDWEGRAFEVAAARATGDKIQVGRVANDLREGARVARHGASEMSAAISRVRYAVEDAHNAGFDVYDDYTVASRQRPNSSAAQAALVVQAESFAAGIRSSATQLLAYDQQLGTKITTAIGRVGEMTFEERGPGPKGPFPEDIGHDPKRRRWTDKDLYPHDPTASDVHQDLIGDCYLDATMGALANANPQWIKDRIHYDDATGTFDVTLWNGHEWQHIAVTQDDIDTNIAHSGASWLDNGQPNAALWPAVLESAYAKQKAPNGDLGNSLDNVIGKGGYAQDAMEALTGNRGTNINPQNVWFTNQHIDQQIAGALSNHQPVTISTTSQGAPLEQSHVFVVEGITGTGSDALVTLRNPWETNCGSPINTPGPLVTVRLGDLIGSGLPDFHIPGTNTDVHPGHHPVSDVNIGSLG